MRFAVGAEIILCMSPLLTWLLQGAVGPALVGLPATWAATDLVTAARRWLLRLRRSDGLSRIVNAAAEGVELSDHEFTSIRRLLEEQGTWVEAGRGSVEDLVALIASCLSDRPGGSSITAARAIVGGLLEFAVRDLEPEWFQQVLFARLERMQADQASALDQALLSVHADLAALCAVREAADANRFALVMCQLERMLDALPPGRAVQGGLEVYLASLIRWLNTDPWPEDPRFSGPVVAPASIERKLRIRGDRGRSEKDLDADEVARQSTRLVILGGPGSGKTWLARRTARISALAALEALAEGDLPDEIELPLYTTCAHLFAMPPGDSIRSGIVSSALGQLPDLGGSRVTHAVRVLFEERNAPTLLVLDSLDEARGVDERIRQADTLPTSWRIVLTSRPASWNHQIAIDNDDPSRLVGALQPLVYPDDVEPFITAWFSQRPHWAATLLAQLRDRPALQPAATVPLLLAFYCIIGGDQPLPARRADLYGRVIRRMLTGRWRGSGDHNPDPAACLETLRDWAWSAATSDFVSGVGTWMDEFPTRRVNQDADHRAALDHVAPPVGLAHLDSGMTQRVFIHRSLREHLLAEHLALSMSVEEAADELLAHLWYDPDWEYAGPAALAMHSQRDEILKVLISRAVNGDWLGADLAAIDGCWEIRRFLARVAQESSQTDWSPEVAQMIGRAMLELATLEQSVRAPVTNVPFDNLREVAAYEWPTWNRLIIKAILTKLVGASDTFTNWSLPGKVARLAVIAPDREEFRGALLEALPRIRNDWDTTKLAEAVIKLGVTTEERGQILKILLRSLAATRSDGTAVALAKEITGLDPNFEQRTHALNHLLGLLDAGLSPYAAGELAGAIARLAVTAQDRGQASRTLLSMLASTARAENAWQLTGALVRLAATADERTQAGERMLQLLGSTTDADMANALAEAIARLDTIAGNRTQARQALLKMLASTSYANRAATLARTVPDLAVTLEDRTQARQALLKILASTTGTEMAKVLAGTIARLYLAGENRSLACESLLQLLASTNDPEMAKVLADAIYRLGATAEDRARAREALLKTLAETADSSIDPVLAAGVVRLSITAEDRSHACKELLHLLASTTDAEMAKVLADAIARLDPTSEDRARAVTVLVGLLARTGDDWAAPVLAEAVASLDPVAEERALAVDMLLGLLARTAESSIARLLAKPIARLAVATDDRSRARELLLNLIARTTDPWAARELAETIHLLDPTAEARSQALDALLPLLDRSPFLWAALDLAKAIAGLVVTAKERQQFRDALLRLASSTPHAVVALESLEMVAELAASAEDRTQIRKTAIPLFLRTTDSGIANALVKVLAGVAVTVEDRTQTRNLLLRVLAEGTHRSIDDALTRTVAGLVVTEEDRTQTRNSLLSVLGSTPHAHSAQPLTEGIIALNPTAVDLRGSGTWPTPPTPALLAAARRNTRLPVWLASLPLLSVAERN